MKRLLSLMVAFAMILSMVPNAFAVETNEDMLPSDMETIGSVDNPEVLAELGSYSLTLASGDTDGYYYAYTAIANGTVSASIDSVTAAVVDDNETEIVTADTEEETVTAAVALTNKTTGATGTDSVAVSAGDIVLIQVTSSAAADITWYGAFTYYAGHETNPIWLEIGENVLTIPAGATVYYCGRFGGMVMSAVGEGLSLEHNGTTYALTAEAQEFACAQASMWEPSTFVITNAGETELTCTLTVNYPLGSMENPAALQIGANTAVISEGSQGYYYTWTAEEAGTLSIEMPYDMGWAYTINNMTTYVYGDTQWSDSDPVVNPGTIEVAAGDEIQIMVNTYDPANEWTAPAGELTFTASFSAATPEIPAVEITQQPVDSNSIVGQNATFTVGVSNTEGVTYQWYLSQDGGATWPKCNYSSAKSATLTFKVYESRIGWQVYCEITDANGNVVTSDVATVTLKPADIEITYQTVGDRVAISGKTTTARVDATTSEGGTITYQWQESADGGKTWSNTTMPGSTTYRLTINAYDTRDGRQYRCKLTDIDGAYTYSEPVTLVLAANPMTVKTQAADAAVPVNVGATFTFEVENYPSTVSYKWYCSNDGGETWFATGLSGYNTSTLTVNAYNHRDGYMYRCLATAKEGYKLYSEEVTLTVKENPMSISVDPESVTVAEDETAVFHVEVSGAVGDVTYQWYYLKPSATKWEKTGATGAKTDTLSIPATASKNGYKYRCVITDSEGNVITSASATLTVE